MEKTMSVMTPTNVAKEHSELYRAAIAFSAQADTAARDAGLPALLIELIKIRTSQINGCAFCLRLHTGDAIKKGENSERLAVLPAWRETSYFTEQEQAALSLSEYVTGISASHEKRDLYEEAVQVLTSAQVSAVSWVTMGINTFNRIALTSAYPVGQTT
jgi:AhpD family alkylhydroperoxidase